MAVRQRTDPHNNETLNIAAPPPPPSAPAAPTSFFQTSIQIIDRLSCIPGFEHYLDPEYLLQVAGADVPSTDPVTTLWNIFRIGNALCELINLIQPEKPLAVNPDNSLASLNLCKKSVFHFRVACNSVIGIPQEDIFGISELYRQNTNGFVRVLKTVSLVLDHLERRGIIDTSHPRPHRFSDPTRSNAPQDNRAKVVRELLETERTYIRDLEILQNYQKEIQKDIHKDNGISPENMLYLFANLNHLVDFQRKFLIGVEANSLQPPESQQFGKLFMQMEEPFSVYEPFCANYERASEIAVEQAANLSRYSHIVEPLHQLPSLLIKPIQRICKYPLLVQEMIKYSDKTMPNYEELTQGLAAIKRAADRVNETRRRVENDLVVKGLETRVKDWREYTSLEFGELLLHDKFVMSSNEVEKELMVYLFENIMICCKELASKKAKKKGPTLQLKGRIFISSITGVVNYTRNGIYALKVLWRDAQMGNFSLRCRNEEQLNQWHSTLERLINETMNSMAPAEPTSNDQGDTTPTTPNYPRPPTATSLAPQHPMPRPISPRLGVPDYYYGPRKDKEEDTMSFIATSDDDEEEEEGGESDQVGNGWDGSTLASSRNASTLSVSSRLGSGRDGGYSPNGYGTPLGSKRSMSDHPVLQGRGGPGTLHQEQLAHERQLQRHPSERVTGLSNSMGRMQIKDGSNRVNPHLKAPFSNHPVHPVHPVHPGVTPNGMRKPPLQPPVPAGPSKYPPPPSHPPGTMQIRPNTNMAGRRQTSPHIYPTRQPSGREGFLDRPAMPPASGSAPNMVDGRYGSKPVRSPSTNNASLLAGARSTTNPGDHVKIKVNYMEDVYVIFVARSITYRELLSKLEKKIRLCGGDMPESPDQFKVQYFDEDGDRVTIKNDEDVQMSFDSRDSSNPNSVLNFFIG